jgi:hypothetical protein
MAAYAVAGMVWFRGGPGYPLAPDAGEARQGSPLEGISQRAGSVGIVVIALVGLLTLRVLSRPPRSAITTMLATVTAAIQFGLFALVVPDGRVLVAVAHVPILLIGMPFDWPGGVTIGSQLPWPVLHQVLLLTVAGLWFMAARDGCRAWRGACPTCGRGTAGETWTRPDQAIVWGRWMVAIAVAVPSFYAITRLAWLVGVPLGVPRSFLEEESASDPSIFVAGAFIGLLALGGAGLTLGLVQPWGERVPAWVPAVGGRPVPPLAAVVPASAVSLLLISSGIGWFRSWLLGLRPEDTGWATTSPGMLLPAWGLALAGATFAYLLRRRGRCSECGS